MSAPEMDAQALARQVLVLQRRERQLERDLVTAHSMYEQSKRALLRNNAELESTVARLETARSELLDAKARAEAASLAKSRFLAIISHEMRTPLNGIIGSMELLLGMPGTTEQGELVRLTHQSAHSLLLIINDVLDFSKAEAGHIHLERVSFDPVACARAVTDLVANVAGAKQVRVTLDVGDGVPERALGDPTRLRQVLLNLADNAVKFTERGFVEVRIRALDMEELEFTVVDSGIGIHHEALRRIFEPFTQEDDSTTRRFGGTGLGLAICKRLVSLMGGALEVESTVGIGSSFRFRAKLPADPDGATHVPAALPVQTPRLAGTRVLLVDDNQVNLRIGRRMLERLECRVHTAGDGREAVAHVRDGTFDVVLMDCSMPVMDGFAATAAIRALEGPRSRVQIVAMTAYAMADDRERCLAAGMDDYLSKPVKLDDLVAVLTRAAARAADADVPDAAL